MMISRPINRVQAIKSKFENLSNETSSVNLKPLYKHRNECERKENKENSFENDYDKFSKANFPSDSSDDNGQVISSSLHKIEVKRSASDSRAPLSRQISDPGKKLHRSHAFRCDRSQKLHGPKRHGSCNSRSETSEFLKMERKLSKDRLKKLGDVLEQQMKKENFTFNKEVSEIKEVLRDSVPDENVPPHILAQYSQVIKPRRNEDKQEAMTDSGVSSETENLDEEKSTGRVRKITSQFEDKEQDLSKSNLDVMEDLAGSSETMKLERKNPHLILTDTLKKALKQPLPVGPPPKKPPRSFLPDAIDKEKSDTKRKLEKLEQVLLKQQARKEKNIYDIAEETVSTDSKQPKEIHYLCTEILDITQRTLLPNSESPLKSCLNKLNCSVTTNSMSSLPYTRLSSNMDSNICSCSQENLDKSRPFMSEKCTKCHTNDVKDGFKCHLNCKCKTERSEFFVDEHIYDEPYLSSDEVKKSAYGTLNSVKVNGSLSRSMEDLQNKKENSPIYDTPCDQFNQKSEFQKLRESFEMGIKSNQTDTVLSMESKLTKSSARSTDHLLGEKFKKKSPERKFSTEVKRHKPKETVAVSSTKRNAQLDVDRENLNRLMNEIYETVTAACIMEENKPGSFPTDQSETSSEESAKLTRSLTEKRKNYVRRVSSRLAYLEPKNIKHTRFRHQTSICSYKPEAIDNPYSTFRSWKSFRTSQSNLNREKMETDSKFNLTDSEGNILSIRNDFDIDSVDNLSIDESTGCVDIELPFEPRDGGLFNLCLVVGLNYMTGEAYVRSVFPCQVKVPQHIESLVFPETLVRGSDPGREWCTDVSATQSYSFVLTDERGERSYGYCRRVLPEGATSCLPLCYCLIGKYRAPGFYYKVLQELESHHGSSDERINSVLQQLFDMDFPSPGEEITIAYPELDVTTHNSPTEQKEGFSITRNASLNDLEKDSGTKANSKNSQELKSKELENSDSKCEKTNSNDGRDSEFKCDGLKEDSKFKDISENESFLYELEGRKLKCQLSNSSNFVEVSNKSKTLPDTRRSDVNDYDYCDFENNNGPAKVLLNLESPIRSKTLKFPLDPRAEETSASQLLDSLGAGLLIKVFGSLLLERKIIIRADKLSQVSSHLEALQGALYPFVWQQPLVPLVPRRLQRDLLLAPLPVLAGMLASGPAGGAGGGFEEGMFIDLTSPSKVLFYQGDESTILPTNSYKTLKTSLQMESLKNKEKGDTNMRNLLISETFLRFFVDILGDFWRFFSVGELKEGDLGRGDVVFDKESFIKNATSKQNQCFLEWFTETAMFNHFIQNMAVRYKESYANTKEPDSKPAYRDTKLDYSDSNYRLIDTPTPNFYQLFEERVLSRRNSKGVDRSGYKNALNKRVRLLKARLKELVG